MKKQKASYTATCPMCLAEHDFNSRKAVEAAWREWRAPGVLLSKIAWQINPENPIAAAEAALDMWRLINEALPVIKAAADRRTDGVEENGVYLNQMRKLKDEIERVIRKATKKERA